MRSLVKLKKLDLSYNEDDGVVECFVRTPEGLKSKWHRIIEEAEWPMTLQTLHLNRIDNPLICAAIIKTLSATMLTKIYVSTWEMDLTYEFTANQRQKIVTATEIINNLLSNTINESDIDFSKIDVRSMPNIINAVAYTQHCDQQILQQHMTPNNIGKLKTLVTYCMLTKSQLNLSRINALPQCILELISSFTWGDDEALPIEIIDFTNDFQSTEDAQYVEALGAEELADL